LNSNQKIKWNLKIQGAVQEQPNIFGTPLLWISMWSRDAKQEYIAEVCL